MGLLSEGFGALELFTEERLPPGAIATPVPSDVAETITYVHEGVLTYRDSMGRSCILQPGGLLRMASVDGCGQGERNASRSHWAHVFRIGLRSANTGGQVGSEQKTFTLAQSRDRLCVVASLDARRGSLRIDGDAQVYLSTLLPGQHVVHELAQERDAWVHVVHGKIAIGDVILTAGDGAAVTGERAVSFTAQENTTILLLDVGKRQPNLANQEGRVVDPAIQPAQSAPAPVPDRGSAAAAKLSGSTLFGLLWDTLVDVLGSAATATLVGRAAHRALARSPELGELSITRANQNFHFVVPRSFDRTECVPDSLRDLLDELKLLLVQQTGNVVFRSFDRVPELRQWMTIKRAA
jgi:quercetin 2,3-dioxygenase